MIRALLLAASLVGSGTAQPSAGAPPETAPPPTGAPPMTASHPAGARPVSAAAGCLTSGDGYFRAHLAGAVDADIDWPDLGTVCEGEAHGEIPVAADSADARGTLRDGAVPAHSVPAGVRLSFRRGEGARPNLLFVFGISGVREGEPLHAAGANLTIIVQGTSHIYSTRGDARCTVDTLTQRALEPAHRYRLEVRGFCTQPAHAVRGNGEVLVSRFDFAGSVDFGSGEAAP